MQEIKMEPLKSCNFDGPSQSGWLITAHLERIWNQHFGTFWDFESVRSQLEWTDARDQNGSPEILQFRWLSLVRLAYHGSFRENLESTFWDIFGLSVAPFVLRLLEVAAGPQPRSQGQGPS